MHATSFDGLAATFLAVHQHEGEGDFPALALDGVDGFEGGSASGDHVINDNDRIARFEITFDLFAGAVAFGLLADGEDLEGFGRIFHRRGHTNGKGNGIGTEGHSTDGIDLEVLGMDLGTDGVPAEVADEERAEGIEGGNSAVDVEIALFAGGEGEDTGADGFLEQKFFQGCGGLEHEEMMVPECKWWKAEKVVQDFSPMPIKIRPSAWSACPLCGAGIRSGLPFGACNNISWAARGLGTSWDVLPERERCLRLTLIGDPPERD